MNARRLRVVFVVGNAIQQENAIAVAKHISAVMVCYLNLWTGTLHNSPVDFNGHSPDVSLGRISRILLRSPIASTDITVLPQDVGLLQRLLARRAKRAGSTVVLMPDGVAARGANANGSRTRVLARTVLDLGLRLSALVEGSAGKMGSSNPHVVLSWGPGWDVAFAVKDGDSRFRHTGCPRMDRYATLPPARSETRTLLVCSQPLGIPAWSRRYASPWYTFLESLLAQNIEGCTVRVRLHPAELDDATVPARLRAAHIDHSLKADLDWASHVASPFSTVLVEALASNRPFFALSADKTFDEQAQRTPFFADERMPVVRWSKEDIQNAFSSLAHPADLASDYLAHVGNSARLTAELLESLASEYISVR